MKALRFTRILRASLIFFSIAPILSTAFAGVKKNEVIFREDFEDVASAGRIWNLGGALSKDEKRRDQPMTTSPGKTGAGLTLEKSEANGNLYLKKTFTAQELAKMKGAIVFLSASLRAEGVSKKPFSYSGVKLQCSFWTKAVKPGTLEASIGDLRPGVYFPDGSFDWTNRGFVLSIPDDVEAGHLVLGLEGSSGKVWYDNVEIKVIESLAVEDHWRPAPYTPHSLPRLRGEMIFPKITEADLQHLGENWKANMIRWNMGGWDRDIFKNGLESTNFDALFTKEMERADQITASGKKYGMLVVLDMMGVSQHGLFRTVAGQNRFVECWKKLAARYRTNSAVWGYDLSNEPHLEEIAFAESDEVLGWNDLVEKTSREIRKIDPVKTIFIEGCQGGTTEGFYLLRPIRVSNVVYSAHMYAPGNLTHQGIYGMPLGVTYPNKDSDIESLERALRPVIDFQKKWKVPIFVGEFGCVRWAPDGSAARYISDCIEIFEKYGWDWCHHCYRDWQGWDPEYPEDKAATKRSETQTETEKILRSWFSKNQKPPL